MFSGRCQLLSYFSSMFLFIIHPNPSGPNSISSRRQPLFFGDCNELTIFPPLWQIYFLPLLPHISPHKLPSRQKISSLNPDTDFGIGIPFGLCFGTQSPKPLRGDGCVRDFEVWQGICTTTGFPPRHATPVRLSGMRGIEMYMPERVKGGGYFPTFMKLVRGGIYVPSTRDVIIGHTDVVVLAQRLSFGVFTIDRRSFSLASSLYFEMVAFFYEMRKCLGIFIRQHLRETNGPR